MVRCGGKGFANATCYAEQNIVIEATGQRLVGLTVGYLGPDSTPWIFFELPLGIFLPAGMAITIENNEKILLPIRICSADGCKASMKLEQEMIDAMRKGTQGKIAFLEGAKQQQITVDISLMGFSQAFSSLKQN